MAARVWYKDGQFDGQFQDIPESALVQDGDYTRPIDLKGDKRAIERIELLYRFVSFVSVRGKSAVCGRPPVKAAKLDEARAMLAGGAGIIKTAKLTGLGVGTVHKLRRETA